MMKTKLQEFLDIEKTHGFYDEVLCGIPIWHYYRYYYRYKYVSSKSGVVSKNDRIPAYKKLLYAIAILAHSVKSLSVLLLRGQQVKNVVYAFARLSKTGDVYFDKFTDPVIDAASIQDDVRIFQFSFRFDYRGCRRNESLVCSIEILYVLSFLLAPFYALCHFFSFGFLKINRVYKKAKAVMPMGKSDLLFFHLFYLRSRVMTSLLKCVFRRLKVERLLGVDRKVYETAIDAAHQLGIPSYEFQHGVTFGETAMYSGPSCPQLDPDYFLAFGEIWKGPQFGIAPENIVNIGWAYKDEVRNLFSGKERAHAVMVVSSPEITFKMLQTAKELAEAYPEYVFEIRCHPMERYNDEQKSIVDSVPNMQMADMSIDSNIAIGQYAYVIGENSSVVYEALSLGKRVGRICFNGMVSKKTPGVDHDGFCYMQSVADFSQLINSSSAAVANSAYSDFNPEIVRNLPHKDYRSA